MKHSAPIDEICNLLTEYTGAPLRIVGEGELGATGRWDAVLEGPTVTFLVEYKSTAGVEAVGAALREIEKAAPRKSRWVPLLVVPFMGEVGKEMCQHAGVAWLDLSGNARITMPRLRIAIEGKPNVHVSRGRPSDPFAPKASRITRILLLHPGVAWSQSDLVRKAEMDKGFVSRMIQRLEHAGLLERDAQGLIHVRSPGELLGAWRAAYDFSRHEIIRAVVAARSGPDLVQRVTEKLHESGIHYAATGLASAWAYAPFASYRTATVYVDQRLNAETMKTLGARESSTGANLWLVVPNDDGVFTGSNVLDTLVCVSPLQTYLDLKGQPERAEEAAEELRRVHLPWAAT